MILSHCNELVEKIKPHSERRTKRGDGHSCCSNKLCLLVDGLPAGFLVFFFKVDRSEAESSS